MTQTNRENQAKRRKKRILRKKMIENRWQGRLFTKYVNDLGNVNKYEKIVQLKTLCSSKTNKKLETLKTEPQSVYTDCKARERDSTDMHR